MPSGDSLSEMGLNFGEPPSNTQIEQADNALHPSVDAGIMALVMKTRIRPETKVHIDHILSRAIQRGKFIVALSSDPNQKYNAAEGLVMSDMMTSIALEGKGRKELIEIVSELPKPHRFMGGSGGSYQEEINA